MSWHLCASHSWFYTSWAVSEALVASKTSISCAGQPLSTPQLSELPKHFHRIQPSEHLVPLEHRWATKQDHLKPACGGDLFAEFLNNLKRNHRRGFWWDCPRRWAISCREELHNF
jgi:hypothetical protein